MAATYTIFVSLAENPKASAFIEKFDVAEHKFIELRAANQGTYGIIPMLVCVIQTDSVKNFSSDLFLPTFIHVALKANTLIAKIIIGFICLLLDLLTLPIRLLTLIPRIVLIPSRENHPAYKYLQHHSQHFEAYQDVNPIYCTAMIRRPDRSTSNDGPYYLTPIPQPIDGGLRFV